MRVLIVDDDPVSRAVAERLLQAPGREIVTAADGTEAWDLLKRRAPSIIISDWAMPGVDGLELCRRARARGGDYAYFILLSATNWTRERYLEAMDAGVDDFLPKPLDAAHLAVRLRAAERLLGFMSRLRDLEGVVPICSYCRRLRDDQEAYHQMESYFQKHSNLVFSHGICPDCLRRNFPEEGLEPA